MGAKIKFHYNYLGLYVSETQKKILNTLYGCETTVIFSLKIESVPKIIVFDLKNYGEKWSRKNHFEIPPRRKMVVFDTEFVVFGNFLK